MSDVLPIQLLSCNQQTTDNQCLKMSQRLPLKKRRVFWPFVVPFSRRERAFTMSAYRYHFSNGETISIEIPDDWGEILIDLDRQEYNNDHKETRRHYSLEGKVYEGMDYAVEDSGLEALFAGPTDEERLHAVIRQLSPGQQEMIRAIYFENVSVNDYAARMGVTQSAISHRLQTVKKKLKKLLG